jgi:hypothetical protein
MKGRGVVGAALEHEAPQARHADQPARDDDREPRVG